MRASRAGGGVPSARSTAVGLRDPAFAATPQVGLAPSPWMGTTPTEMGRVASSPAAGGVGCGGRNKAA